MGDAWAWAREAVEGRPLVRLARPLGAQRWPALRHAARALWLRPVPATRRLPAWPGPAETPEPSQSLTDPTPQSSLDRLPSPRHSSIQLASRPRVLSLYLGESPVDGLGARADVSRSSETPSEAEEAELPPHLAFDRHTPVLVFDTILDQDSARVGFHNTSGRRLKLNIQWGKIAHVEEDNGGWDRISFLERITTTLGKTELEPGEATDLLVHVNFGNWPQVFSRHWHGSRMALEEPFVVELHSEAGGAERRLAEVELLLVWPDNLVVDLFMSLPFSPRAVLRCPIGPRVPMWLRLDEPPQGLVRVLHPERHLLVLPQPAEPLSLPLRLTRALRTQDLELDGEPQNGLPRMSYTAQLGRCMEADEADVEAVGAARGREERQRLIRELSTAAFQRPSLPEEPHGRFEVELRLQDSHTLTVFPAHGLVLPQPPERAHLLLENTGTHCRRVWTATLPVGCPVELEATEGVLEPHSRGHLGLALLPRPDGPDSETLVTLALRYTYAPSEEHGDAALPQRLADYLDQEELVLGSVAHFSVPLILPPRPDQDTDQPSQPDSLH